MSDVTGLVAAFMAWRATQREVQKAKGQGQEVSFETAKAKRNKKKAAIGCREEYRMREAGPMGLQSSLSYRRTGRCPSWYGPGTCTLEMYSRRQWSWAFWRRRSEPPACWRRCVDEAEAGANAE